MQLMGIINQHTENNSSLGFGDVVIVWGSKKAKLKWGDIGDISIGTGVYKPIYN